MRKGKRKRATSKKTDNENSHEASVFENLPTTSLDFDYGVAVWLHELREMSNEIFLFLNLEARNYCCVSRCLKFTLRTKLTGIIYMFEKKDLAIKFCTSLPEVKCPHGDYPFRAEHLGTYLRTVAEIEDKMCHGRNVNSDTDTKIIIRNLHPHRKVLRSVVQLCSVFGCVTQYELLQDIGENFHFHHAIVGYRHAVLAFAAKLGLNGKSIAEQEYPLEVEVFPDEKVKFIYTELLKRNKMLFQP